MTADLPPEPHPWCMCEPLGTGEAPPVPDRHCPIHGPVMPDRLPPEECARAVKYWRWCWDCGATERDCGQDSPDGKCCPDCRHRDTWPAAPDDALTCDASLVSERGKVLFECDKREGHEDAHTDKGQRWTTRDAAPDGALGDSCGATVVDLLGKTRTCSLPAGHVGDHVADGHVYWAQADAALAVLAELVALEDEPHPNGHTSEECYAWQDDYRGRRDAAWEGARALVATRETP